MARGRIDGQADLFAERFDFPDERRDLFAQFDVDDDFIRAGLGKGSSRISGREHIR